MRVDPSPLCAKCGATGGGDVPNNIVVRCEHGARLMASGNESLEGKAIQNAHMQAGIGRTLTASQSLQMLGLFLAQLHRPGSGRHGLDSGCVKGVDWRATPIIAL